MDASPSRMLLRTRRYYGRVSIADALFLRPSRGRASNATLLRNHHENAITAPRSCILMTSASLKPLRNHCKTRRTWVRNHHETHDSKKGLMRRFFEPPMPSSQSAKSCAIPTHVGTRSCTYVLRMPCLPHPTMMLENRSKTTTKRTKKE